MTMKLQSATSCLYFTHSLNVATILPLAQDYFSYKITALYLLSVHFVNFKTSSGVTASFFSSSSSVIVFFAFDCLAKNPPPFFLARPAESSFELDDLPLMVI